MYKTVMYSLSSVLLLVLGSMVFPQQLIAQEVNPKLWTTVDEQSIPQTGTRYIKPNKYKVLKLNVEDMKQALGSAPMSGTPSVQTNPAYLSLPWPDGTIKMFQIIESPVMAPALAEKYPDIKTYKGTDVNDPTKYIRFDLTPQGFHAMILTEEGTVYIDPYFFGGGDIKHYICYYKKDLSANNNAFSCGVHDDLDIRQDNKHSHSNNSYRSAGGLRTYRLAMAVTGEYTVFHGGTVMATAAVTTTVNRINTIYERDLSVHFDLVANNNNLIYDDPATDPYSGSISNMMRDNHDSINAIIGAANYDIGHLLGTWTPTPLDPALGNGLANLHSVCVMADKGKGVSLHQNPIGDAFDVDYICHEIGHQFGAKHPQSQNCANPRSVPLRIEPGSGSTIMGYAGICTPANNIQTNSDDYFNGKNLEEMAAHIAGTGGCRPAVPTGNHEPTIDTTTGNITIPKGTPFYLDATANDMDASDVLTYCWEQMDVGSVPIPTASFTAGPAFRSLSPVNNSRRYFPNLNATIANTTPKWEVLPNVGRTMNFRLTVRDNAMGGGCYDQENLVVTVDNASGPFLVTYPNAQNIVWAVNSMQTVTWDVANTNTAPVNCANVHILLSTDGGLTYPDTLVKNTTNDGNQQIAVPNKISTQARIMILAANGSTFFDISNHNFTIYGNYALTVERNKAICRTSTTTYTVNTFATGGYSSPINLATSALPTGITALFSTNPVVPGNNTTLTLTSTNAAVLGDHSFNLTATSPARNETFSLNLQVNQEDAIALTMPTNMAAGITPGDISFEWTSIISAAQRDALGIKFTIEVATDAAFTNIIRTENNLATTTHTFNILDLGTTYYWRVRTSGPCGDATNATASFTTMTCFSWAGASVPTLTSPANMATNHAFGFVTFDWTSTTPPPYLGLVNEQYDIQIATDALFTNIIDTRNGWSATTYTNTVALSPGTTYYWRVRATGSCGNSVYSSTFSFTTVGCLTWSGASVPTLTSPANMATNQQLSNLLLTWTTTTPPTYLPALGERYNLEVAKDAAFNDIVYSKNNISALSDNVTTTLDFAATYYWRVRATGLCGNSAYSSTFSFSTVNCRWYIGAGIPGGFTNNVVSDAAVINIPALPDGQTIQDINVAIRGYYENTPDVSFDLETPIAGNPSIDLLTNNCPYPAAVGPGYWIDLTLDDESLNNFACHPLHNNYRPTSPLSVLDGQSAVGNWTLEVTDNPANPGIAYIPNWAIQVCYNPLVPMPAAPLSQTKITEMADLSAFNVMPNPNTGNFVVQVDFDAPKTTILEITNALGQVVKTYQQNTASFNIPVNVQEYGSGIYFVALKSENKTVTKKVVVAP